MKEFVNPKNFFACSGNFLRIDFVLLIQTVKMSKENLKSNYQTPSSVARKTNVICKSSLLLDTVYADH